MEKDKNYKEQYLLYCADLNACTSKEEVKRHNAAMIQLGKLYHKIEKEEDRSFLLELLQDENGRTRELVAAHCLGLGVYTREAKRVLKALSKSKNDPSLAFEAKATLDVWKKQGYLMF